MTFTMTDRLPGFISHGLTYRAGDTTRGRFYDEGNLTSSSQGGAGGGGLPGAGDIYSRYRIRSQTISQKNSQQI